MLRQLAATLAIAALVAPLGCGSSQQSPRTGDPVVQAHPGDPAVVVTTRTAVQPKALAQTVQRGLTWLAGHQLESGGWGQGDEANQLRSGEPAKGTANVADTSMALLAFIRAGHTPRAGGDHAKAVSRGLNFIMSQIEESDRDSLNVTSVHGTRVQLKIGEYVDTFAAMMVLTEAKSQMADTAGNARLDAALAKVIHKVEKNQRANGSWDDRGWAPVLSQALAAKGLNRASQVGAPVSREVLLRVENQAKNGQMATQASAGVGLYGDAAKSANIRDDAETKKSNAAKLKAKAAKQQKPSPMNQSPDAPSKAEIDAADAEATIAVNAASEQERQLVRRLDDPSFIAGFGNNGGEEFLSYLLISETLVQRGGDEWKKWDGAISQMVGKVQNEDGSWNGQHCITGRTFCTAAALLVLLGDRTPATQNVIAG